MRMVWIIAAVAFQVAVLAYVAGEREWVLRTGRTIVLRTMPVDPRDPMRGDYVRLRYEMSSVAPWRCEGKLAELLKTQEPLPPGTRVYARLHETEEGLAEFVALTDTPPREGLFIRGRTERYWGQGLIPVRYGLEAFFLEQGRALEMEQRRNRDGFQLPLEMIVAVNPRGLAVIRGHRWGELAVNLELQTEPAPGSGQPETRRLVGAELILRNASARDLAIVDLPQNRSWALVSAVQWGEENWHWVEPTAPPPSPQPDHVIVLKPGQAHTNRIEFADPAWFVRGRADGERHTPEVVTSLAELNRDFAARFRFEYRPPDRRACAGLPHAELIWHGRLATRAFTPAGRVD